MLLYMSKINSFEAVYNDAEVFRKTKKPDGE